MEEVRIRLSDVALNLPDSGSSSCASLALDIHGLDAEPSGKQLVIADWALAARTLHWTGPGDGPLRIALLEKPTGQDELVIKDVLLGDTATTIAAARALPLERDVITGWMKEVRLSGVDPAGLFRGPQRVPRVVLGPSGLVVARDKTLPDQPWRYRPLPARLLRALPVGCGIDTVVLEGLDVTYHDRADAERPFAHLKFHSIAGRVMHLSHSPGDSLVVEATCTFGRRTPIHLHLTTAIDDTTDVMDVQAQAGAMTFRELGPAMAALAGIGAEEGRLDTLIMKLRADDRRADGRLLARYEDLRLERKSGRARVLDPLFNAVINAVVRTDRTGERSDDGWVRYSVDRRRDRAVFNYLWSGVREGMKASVLPEVVQKR
ncbi:MAG: hypothetical protein IT227_06275 [Flavobacteriales bacterium]|nr:hypothetical protein [Flavobacteriales bacterium]